MRLLDIIRIKICPNRLEHKKLRHQRSKKNNRQVANSVPDNNRDSACSVVKKLCKSVLSCVVSAKKKKPHNSIGVNLQKVTTFKQNYLQKVTCFGLKLLQKVTIFVT